MKIGLDAKRFFHNQTGLGNYSRDLVRILSAYFPDNQYVLYNTKPSKRLKIEDSSKNVIEVLPTSFWYKKLHSLWRSFGMTQQIKKDNITVFHGLSGEIPFGLPKNIKKIVTIHDLIFLRFPHLYSFWDRKIHYYKFLFAAKKSDVIIAISEQTKQDIINFLKIAPEKIKVVYQGCAAVFKENFSEIEKKEVQQKYNLPDKFLLNVGTLETRKNALTIVKATKNTKYPLFLIGKKTDYYQEIENYSKENDLKNVFHLSNVSQKELAIIYQFATVFVYPSVFEGFGIPIVEALFSKTPVITNKYGVFPEAGGENSLYIDPKNVAEMESTIQILWQNEAKRKEITEKGFSFVQQFNDEQIAKKIIKIYQ